MALSILTMCRFVIPLQMLKQTAFFPFYILKVTPWVLLYQCNRIRRSNAWYAVHVSESEAVRRGALIVREEEWLR